ncbi:MAG: Metallo-beta-lactamase family protein, partial [Candidatus Woesebacteria bacterium GW2011_GWA1_39_8]
DPLIIDAGADGDYIITQIVKKNLIPKYIVATHGHFDHILAVSEIKLAFGIPFLVSKQDAFLVRRMVSSAKYYTKVTPDPAPTIDEDLNSFGKITLGKEQLEVLKTPGHTPGSVSVYAPSNKMLFCGDLVFAGNGVGRTDFKYSDYGLLVDSIQNTANLDPATIVLPGHGEPTYIADIKAMTSKMI